MTVTPDDVLTFSKPTRDFLCGTDSKFDVDFIDFTIRDYDTKDLLFDIKGDGTKYGSMEVDIDFNEPFTDDSFRKIKYTFSDRVLSLPLISTALTFKVGKEPLSNFRMIERHYFRNKLIKSFDFTFGFCIPGSTNTWEAVYDVPALDHSLVEEMIRSPYETQSDSFYFVGDELIMHNKASYKYVLEDEEGEEEKEQNGCHYLDQVAQSKNLCIRNGLNPNEKKTSMFLDDNNDEEKDVKHLSKALQYANLRDERFEKYEDETKEYDDDDYDQHSNRWSKDMDHFEAKN